MYCKAAEASDRGDADTRVLGTAVMHVVPFIKVERYAMLPRAMGQSVAGDNAPCSKYMRRAVRLCLWRHRAETFQ